MKRIYLDNAAATPVDKKVLNAMMPFFSDTFQNPSALYKGAREAKSALDSARSSVAQTLGARSGEIIFTAGGSESVNLAISGVMNKFPKNKVIITAIEHDAVINSADKYNSIKINVDKNGLINLASLAESITDDTVLVSVMFVNNEVGSIQPLQEISKIIANVKMERKKVANNLPIYFHTDACQAPMYLDCNVNSLGVDLMTLNGGKMHGPKQSGILYVRTGVMLEPLIFGGGQEYGLRSGTENVAFAIGFAEALRLSAVNRKDRAESVTELREYFIDKLVNNYSAQITGSSKNRIANNVQAIFTGCDNERILFSLDDLGVDAAAGSACSASNDEPSHVLLAMGYSAQDARSSIRFSLGKQTTKEELDSVIEKLSIALKA